LTETALAMPPELAGWRVATQARENVVFISDAGETATLPVAVVRLLAARKPLDVDVRQDKEGTITFQRDEDEPLATVPSSLLREIGSVLDGWLREEDGTRADANPLDFEATLARIAELCRSHEHSPEKVAQYFAIIARAEELALSPEKLGISPEEAGARLSAITELDLDTVREFVEMSRDLAETRQRAAQAATDAWRDANDATTRLAEIEQMIAEREAWLKKIGAPVRRPWGPGRGTRR
jgi:hypothetical protein